MKLVLTCAHGGNHIPTTYEDCFKNASDILQTHRGYDLGALDVFHHLKPLADVSFYSETSRLLIELNRSLHHKNLFSEFSKTLSEDEKTHLITNYYSDYRNAVETAIKSRIDANEKVVHISIHSFTPILDQIERNCDIGLLYDTSILQEKIVCSEFKHHITRIQNTLHVRYNYPYLGKADGFPTYLRKQFNKNYIGVELEINQKFSKNNTMEKSIKDFLYKALKQLL